MGAAVVADTVRPMGAAAQAEVADTARPMGAVEAMVAAALPRLSRARGRATAAVAVVEAAVQAA